MIVEHRIGKANADIRAKMHEAKLTQADVAKELGVSVQTFGKWLKEPMDYERRSKVEKVIDGHLETSADKMLVQYDDGAFPLSHAHADDSGYDIHIPIDAELPARGSLIINTGVHVAIPRGFAGELKSKSGLNIKHSIRGEGEIDSGYSGAIIVKLYNDGYQPYLFRRGDKIIQLVIRKVATPELVTVDKLPETERGEGGLGSTGR